MSDSQDKSVRDVKSGVETPYLIEIDGKKLSVEEYIWHCVNTNRYPDRSYLSFGERLKFAFWRAYKTHLSQDEQEAEGVARVIGKSMKQLMRYFEGAEPPFSAVQRLALAADIPVGWLAGEDYATNERRSAIAAIPALHDSAPIYEKTPDWADELIVQSKARLSPARPSTTLDFPIPPDVALDDAAVEVLLKAQRRDKELEPKLEPDLELITEDREESLKRSPTLIYVRFLREVIDLVIRVRRDEKSKINAHQIVEEATHWHGELLNIVKDIGDIDELRSLLPWIESSVRREIASARREPGAGKQSA